MNTPALRRFLAKRLHISAWLSLLALVFANMLPECWFAELFSHFVPFYALIFLLAAALLANRWRMVWVICCLGCCLWLAQPFRAWQKPAASAAWTAVWYNVHLYNPNPEAEVRLLKSRLPEIIALAEVPLHNPHWQTLKPHYPYGCEHREDSPFALAVWSRFPLVSCDVADADGFPYIRALTESGVAVFALHPPPPVNKSMAASRQAYLDAVADLIKQESRVLVMGDLNTSPFSPLFRRFMQTGSLKNSRLNAVPTWKLFGLNIDHVLYRSNRNETVSSQALPWQYSDHRALWVNWYPPQND